MKVKLFLILMLITVTAYGDDTRILVLGDSLSAAHGIDQDQGWVALLQQRLEKEKLPYTVVNASISGETTAGGLSRLPQLLQQHKPGIVLLELGANDGLRGLSVTAMKKNLAEMVEYSSLAGAKVLLIGMQLPPNYGEVYTRMFRKGFVEVSQIEHVKLVPFLLAGIGEDKNLFQSDGLHPTAAAQPKVLDNVWQGLAPMLNQ
jgi:acyl-CoA thioesterase-1